MENLVPTLHPLDLLDRKVQPISVLRYKKILLSLINMDCPISCSSHVH